VLPGITDSQDHPHPRTGTNEWQRRLFNRTADFDNSEARSEFASTMEPKRRNHHWKREWENVVTRKVQTCVPAEIAMAGDVR
jgi:hypothetical protein